MLRGRILPLVALTGLLAVGLAMAGHGLPLGMAGGERYGSHQAGGGPAVPGAALARAAQAADSRPVAAGGEQGTVEAQAHPLAYALQAVGAAPEEARVIAWSRLPAVPSFAQAAELVRRLGRRLGTAADWPVNPTRDYLLEGVSLEGFTAPDTYLQVACQVVPHTGGQPGEKEAYLLVSLARRGAAATAGLPAARQAVAAAYAAEQLSPRLQVQVSGTLAGKVAAGKRQAVLNRVLAVLGGTAADFATDGETTSVTAYVPGLGPGLTAGGQEVNLQGAVRYHAAAGTTFVELGTPMLDGDF